ncbi:MAG: hypothetical protein M1827_005095 [Pycnora praestabilis]|nr:MAG: hypothetical protein M1827_005095 [Pycnora praestabilis]
MTHQQQNFVNLPAFNQLGRWKHNTFVLTSICALVLHTNFTIERVVVCINDNFPHAYLTAESVLELWDRVEATWPPWAEYMQNLPHGAWHVAGVVQLLREGRLRARIWPSGREEIEGLAGLRSTLDRMLGEIDGVYHFE